MSADEFADRDATGLQAPGKEKTEAEARAFYFKLMGKLILLQAPALAWPLYFAAKAALPMLDAKFRFAHEYGLGWVFVAWYVVYIMRAYLTINANGARAPARVDRPDQHVYRLMSPKGDDQPFCMMVKTGAVGRFNRAQRAMYNTDESLPVFISGLLLHGLMLGPVAVCIALLSMYGRIKFANLYTESLAARGAGFLPSVVAEHLSAALVGVCAIKTLGFAVLPF